MKLLLCPHCEDVFSLSSREDRSCWCGMVTGRYINRTEAVTNGKGISIAIGNGSLLNAHYNLTRSGFKDQDRDFYRFRNPVVCWVRPNEGPGNPHTSTKEKS
jgi:hypothetical protein